MEIPHKIGHIIANRYGVTDTLGRGGIATTYAAKDLTTNQPVALKELSLRHMGEFKVLELFEREARTLKQLHHPAIPSYLDYFYIDTAEDRAFYIVQQLAEGKSLAELVTGGWRTNESGVRQIATKVLEILIYLQAQKPSVIHRDIKPQNLVLGEDGRIFLVDFGAVQDTYRTTVARGSTVVGTYGYMAPEQFRGEAVPATDLYGLGTTLLFLLTHRCPSELPQERLRYNFRDRIQVSEEFADWLQQMVEPDEEDRFSSAKEALAALQGKRIRGKARSPIPMKIIVGLGVAIVVALNAPRYLKAPWLSLTTRQQILPSTVVRSGDIDMLSSILFWDGLLQDKEARVRQATDLLRYVESAEIFELLIARGADVNLPDDKGRTPLHHIAEWYSYGNFRQPLVEALLANGADINARDNYGYTPLHILIKSGLYHSSSVDIENEFEAMIAQTWVANGADINAQDRYGRTSLHWAASVWARQSGRLAEWTTEALIANGADVNAKDHHGRTPLHVSLEHFPPSATSEVINVLIKHGAQVNAQDNNGRTPLHFVIAGKNISGTPGFGELIDAEDEIKIEFNSCSHYISGETIYLRERIAELQVQETIYLRERIAERQVQVWASKVELASLLLTHGARANIRDNLNFTPLELANTCQSDTVLPPQAEAAKLVELLKRHSATDSGDK
ncbi:ankyrin repeat domain-containing protein [Oculatella sp. FACHB-28]|uniref:protein kinase domain-containing protein n=1 Tax=Oculatella sp. FACHB-28 TaxID=2692845 RepID=UPI0016870428|nr:ankyrin repeat domain-containing protein [Oculatella sp. FACHB-28]MBD2057694.1 ankyrin repeat domain-containing protein [Oculatella sp. FACHB-28]